MLHPHFLLASTSKKTTREREREREKSIENGRESVGSVREQEKMDILFFKKKKQVGKQKRIEM